MPKQSFDLIDYFGPLAAWIMFFSVIFVISVTCILWCCIGEKDDSTVFAKWYIGPHPQQKQPLLKQRRKQHKMVKNADVGCTVTQSNHCAPKGSIFILNRSLTHATVWQPNPPNQRRVLHNNM